MGFGRLLTENRRVHDLQIRLHWRMIWSDGHAWGCIDRSVQGAFIPRVQVTRLTIFDRNIYATAPGVLRSYTQHRYERERNLETRNDMRDK